MSGPEFFQTQMGQRFYNSTMPRIADALERIADRLDKLSDEKKTRGNPDGPTPA